MFEEMHTDATALVKECAPSMSRKWAEAIDNAIKAAAEKAYIKILPPSLMRQRLSFYREKFHQAGIFVEAFENLETIPDVVVHLRNRPFATIKLVKISEYKYKIETVYA